MNPSPAATSAPNLATCYQEILTVAARLRSRKFAVGDSAVFRTQIRKALQQAETSALSLRYEQDDIRLASFAAIALMDETILNSSNPAFRDWAQKPLALDLYGTGHAGETFFEYLKAILQRRQIKATVDLLEVYLLCLMLGFRGRYSSGSGEQLRAWRDPAAETILRNRGVGGGVELSRGWIPETAVEMPPISRRRSQIALSCAAGIFAACLLFLAAYHFLLNRGVAELAGLIAAR
jgi:type VI secretion system protein ImpK